MNTGWERILSPRVIEIRDPFPLFFRRSKSQFSDTSIRIINQLTQQFIQVLSEFIYALFRKQVGIAFDNSRDAAILHREDQIYIALQISNVLPVIEIGHYRGDVEERFVAITCPCG